MSQQNQSRIASELGKGNRRNSDKPRFDLLEPFAQLQKAQIFTKGAKKYPTPRHNWLLGMDWSKCHASALRHANAWAMGLDYDYDPSCALCMEGITNGKPDPDKKWNCENHTGELHSALAAWNWDALTSYYKWFPQGDDRLHNVMPKPRIGLDIDEVTCVWVDKWCELHNIPIPSSWYFQWDIRKIFEDMKNDDKLDEFYLNLEPREPAENLPFEPVCYISHRPVSDEVTKKWLEKHNFPLKPVFHVESRMDKIKIALEQRLNIFVEDSYETYKAMNEAGICCYLMDAKHNRRYDVGYRRIKSLKELA